MTGNIIIDVCLYALMISFTTAITVGIAALLFHVILPDVIADWREYKLKKEYLAWTEERRKKARENAS